MRKLILAIGTMMLASVSFADTSSSSLSQSLASALKTQPSMHAKLDSNDITIVYGGADISRKPTLVTHTTVA